MKTILKNLASRRRAFSGIPILMLVPLLWIGLD